MLLKYKHIGQWIENIPGIEEPTLLDNVAYDIYCEYRQHKETQNISTQYVIMRFPKMYQRFYNMAKKKIRLEKLEKLNEKSNL